MHHKISVITKITKTMTMVIFLQNILSSSSSLLFSLIYPIAFASVVGIISGMIMESIVMIIPFMITRKFSGGYHADSFGKCLIISSIVIAGALLIGKNIYNGVTLNALYIVASILLIIFSPIDSINKRLDDDDKMFFKKITIVIVFVIFL